MSATDTIRPRVEAKNPAIQPRLLDVSEAGIFLGVGHKVVRKLIQGGELPYVQRIPGRSPYLLDIADLDRWIDTNKTRASAF